MLVMTCNNISIYAELSERQVMWKVFVCTVDESLRRREEGKNPDLLNISLFN